MWNCQSRAQCLKFWISLRLLSYIRLERHYLPLGAKTWGWLESTPSHSHTTYDIQSFITPLTSGRFPRLAARLCGGWLVGSDLEPLCFSPWTKLRYVFHLLHMIFKTINMQSARRRSPQLIVYSLDRLHSGRFVSHREFAQVAEQNRASAFVHVMWKTPGKV